MAEQQRDVPEGMITITHVMYGLHAFSALTGLLTPAFIVTAFLTGWPSIIAIIINYAKMDEVHGTYLESHFRWQRGTFWFALLWLVIAGALFMTVLLIPLAFVLLGLMGIWVGYRLIRGWLNLTECKAMIF